MTKRKPKRSTQGKGRFSARKKAEAVRRLVAGEDLDDHAEPLGRGPFQEVLVGPPLGQPRVHILAA